MVGSTVLSNKVDVLRFVGEHLQEFVNPCHPAVYSTLLGDMEAVQAQFHCRAPRRTEKDLFHILLVQVSRQKSEITDERAARVKISVGAYVASKRQGPAMREFLLLIRVGEHGVSSENDAHLTAFLMSLDQFG